MSSDWSPVTQGQKDDISDEFSDAEPEASTREKVVEHMIIEFSHELREAHAGKYDIEKAELTAALCLDAQKEIAEFLAEAELLAKEKKSTVDRIEGEQYFFYKENATSKLTDAALKHMIAKDGKVKEAQMEQYKAEANYNKWRNLFSTLKDGHIYFRGLAKGKNDWS